MGEMNSFKLFHLGDVHFPDHDEDSIADDKDKGFDRRVAAKIAPNPLNVVLKHIVNEATHSEVEPVFLLSGDLTSRGEIEPYKAFVERLDDLLLSRLGVNAVHAVPGNHDIVQNLVESNEQYDHMIQTWDAVKPGENVIASDRVRRVEMELGTSNLNVYSVNTCAGCGGRRDLLDGVKGDLILGVRDSETDEQKLYESLDTPAVELDHLQTLASMIGDEGRNVSVVLAHHNLLPQRIPRIDIYTELINSGSMREFLLESKVPILLCHGHIHDDPIEVISTPKNEGKLVISSAPELKNGYNIVSFAVGAKGYPVGCIIEEYRIKPGGGVFCEGEHCIPLCTHMEFRSKGDDRIVEYLEFLKYERTVRGSEFLGTLKDNGKGDDVAQVMSVLDEAKWFGLIDVQKYGNADFDGWLITKVLP